VSITGAAVVSVISTYVTPELAVFAKLAAGIDP